MVSIQSCNNGAFKSLNKTNNPQGENIQKPSTGAIVGGVLAGITARNMITKSRLQYSPMAMGKLQELSDSLKPDELTQIQDAIAKTVKNSGLEAKGVSILKATSENSAAVAEVMRKEIDNTFLKYLPEQFKGIGKDMLAELMSSGKNACYSPAAKKIIVPENKLGLALFHEAGHAMNGNLSIIGKSLQNCRGLALLYIPIAMTALLKTKKAPDEKPKNNLDKATTFIKNNAGKLTFATFLPLLIEEGMASIKGGNYAKQLLSPELAKKVAKTNALGFSTYLALAICSSLGIYLGTKVKDAIASNKKIERKTLNKTA